MAADLLAAFAAISRNGPPLATTRPASNAASTSLLAKVHGAVAAAVAPIFTPLRRLPIKSYDPLRERDPALAACLQASLWNRAADGGPVGSAIVKQRGPQPDAADAKAKGRNCAVLDGFSLHGNTRVGKAARVQLEELCRYLLRPGVPAKRISLTEDGRIKVELRARATITQ